MKDLRRDSRRKTHKRIWIISLTLLIFSVINISYAEDLLSPRIGYRDSYDEELPFDFYLGLAASKGEDSTRVYWGNGKVAFEREHGDEFKEYTLNISRGLGNFALTASTYYKEARELSNQSISLNNKWEYFALGIGISARDYDRKQTTSSLHLWAPLPNGEITLVISERYKPYWKGNAKHFLSKKKVWFIEGSVYYGEKRYKEVIFGANISI